MAAMDNLSKIFTLQDPHCVFQLIEAVQLLYT